MTGKQRLSATVEAELIAAGHATVADGRAASLSAWVNDALRLKADHDRRLQALDDFLATYEVEHGEITEEEMRDAGRQAPLARLLKGVDVAPLDDGLGRQAGKLLGRSRSDDAIDAAVVCLAHDGDDILTSDARDLRRLAEAAGLHVELIPV